MKHTLNTTTHLTAVGYNNGDQGTTITLPVGRIVWGHPCKPKQKIDDDTKQPKRDAAGNIVMETSFGIAIPIAEFNAAVWPVMHAEMSKGFPNGAPGNFAWKFKQPTDIDDKGKPYGEREGCAGCIVLAVSTTLEPPAVFQWDGARWNQMQADAIKCGDYVQAEINFKVNVSTNPRHKSSLYVNPRAIAFVGYGEAIVSSGFAVDPNAAFGNGPPPLPPGASATPIAPAAGAGMPGMPGAQPAAMPGNSPQPAAMPGAPSALPVAAASPPPAPPPVAPAPPVGPQRPADPTHIHDNGNGTEQWFVNGAWDGQAHPVPVAAPAAALPPPVAGFVGQAAGGMPGAPAMPAMPGQMPPR